MITAIESALERHRAIAERVRLDRPELNNSYVLLRMSGDDRSYAILGSYRDRGLLERYPLAANELFLWIGPGRQAPAFVE